MLEASGGGSQTIQLGDAARSNAFVKISMIRDKDLIACLRPRYHKIGAM